MIALDTNVIVRILVDDDPEQSAVARSLVGRALADGAALFVPAIVVCETVWVLSRSYRFPRVTVASAVLRLLTAEQLTIESRDEAERALGAYSRGQGDFADLLIRERATTHGAHAVATFDRALLDLPGFVDPDPARWPSELSLHERAPTSRRARKRRAVAGASGSVG